MSAPEKKISPRAVWWLLATVLVVELMDLLDSTIVNVAGPSLGRSLGASPVGLQWVIGGYALTLGAGLVLGGRLGDRYGRRPMFLFGLVAFTFASLLCAIAPGIGLLIAFRLVQGVAGAMMLPQGLGILRDNLAPRDLTKALALFGPVLGLGGVLGPVLGGALVDWDLFGLGWRLVFLVNVPVGLVALVLAWRLVPRGGGVRKLRVDVVGAGLVAAASALLVLPLNEGQAAGWPLWTWLSLSVAGMRQTTELSSGATTRHTVGLRQGRLRIRPSGEQCSSARCRSVRGPGRVPGPRTERQDVVCVPTIRAACGPGNETAAD